jgi:hypothetical protein
MANNEGKWKVFQNAVGLDGPPGVRQNLNEDLQENLGNELDHALRRHQGSCVASGWAVTAGAGLSVTVATGVGFVDGQLVGGSGTVSGLPGSESNIKIYVQAGTPWGNPASQWPASFGFTTETGTLAASQLLLALVGTSASAVTLVVDQRIFTEPVPTIVATIDDTVPPAGAATSLRSRFGMLARRIKEIIGGTAWTDVVPISLTAVLAKFHATTGHKHTGVTGDAPKLDPATGLTYVPVNKAGDTMSGPLTLSQDPTVSAHAATKGYADTKFPSAGGSITGAVFMTVPLHPNSGGTGLNFYSPGDILFASANQVLAVRNIGASGKVLTSAGGVPVWGDAIPAGTRMLFDMDAAPAGWVRVFDVNDVMVRFCSGARQQAGSWVISGLTGPAHQHYIYGSAHAVGSSTHNIEVTPLAQSPGGTFLATGHHLHGFVIPDKITEFEGQRPVTSNGSWRPAYRDVITCYKA